jgi:UDP-N-acetylmuramoyl-tripeptide--D-alanyl-D-alanine ligase
LATQGNLNNQIGVPLTLLRLRKPHAAAVVELGMNHPGEIAALAALARPTVALVNNAQREHLEFMQTIEAVAQENGSVIASLGSAGIAVFPADDAYTSLWRGMAGTRRTLTFSMQEIDTNDTLVCKSAHWSDGAWQVQAQGLGHTLQYRLAIAGRHNVLNSLAAAACALAAGASAVDVERGLCAFEPVKGRSRAVALSVQGRNVTVVDDSYNANPDSVKAAIDVLAELPGPRVLVLGDMGEVGHQGPAFHAEAGRYAQARGIEHLLTLGDQGRVTADAFPGAVHFASMESLQAALPSALVHAHSVLVKGSRFMRMERVVAALMQLHTPIQEHTDA